MECLSFKELKNEVERLQDIWDTSPSEIWANEFSIKKLKKRLKKTWLEYLCKPVPSLWGIKIYLDSGLSDNIVKLVNKNKVIIIDIKEE